jgi:hypothetical protein
MRRKNPDLFNDVSEAEFDQTHAFSKRDASGNVTRAPKAGSYAEERLAELKAERRKYNANDLGYYMGGLPQKGRGAIRGTALGFTGEFHQPSVHNFLEKYHQDAKLVTSEDAVKFKHYMNSDKSDFNRSKPFYPMYYDKGFQYMQERVFWGKLLIVLIAATYA